MSKVCQRAVGKVCLVVVACVWPGPLFAQATLEYTAQQGAAQALSSAQQSVGTNSQNATTVKPLIPPAEETPGVVALTKKAWDFALWVKSMFVDVDGKPIWASIIGVVALVFVLAMLH